MRLTADYHDGRNTWPHITGEYKITVKIGDREVVGYLPTDMLATLPQEHWTWVPVYQHASKLDDKNPLLEVDIAELTNVEIVLFNFNGWWTKSLNWHGISFVAEPNKIHESNCTCGMISS